jgi:D-cysteine desulfhydrase
MMTIQYPSMVDLARLGTPLIPLERLSHELGTTILCKRDDLTGAGLSGNKIRKLEFLIAEALSQNCRGVITCGGEQSNHARATAIAAARMGLGCHLVLRTSDPNSPPKTTANILLDRLTGAGIRWISPEQYAERDAIMAEEASRLERQYGGPFYLIPEGGSNALGAWGYVRCVQELADELGRQKATVVFPVGSGGTAAGLIAGCRLLQLPYRLIGVCVCDDRPTFQQRIAALLAEMAQSYKIDVETPAAEIEIWQDYVGRGYALSQEEELACIQKLAALEGIITDPVYTGKALYGLISELRQGQTLPEPIVFLHTGGIYGLFAKTEELARLLDPLPPHYARPS